MPFPAVGLAAVSNVTAVFCAITLVVPPDRDWETF